MEEKLPFALERFTRETGPWHPLKFCDDHSMIKTSQDAKTEAQEADDQSTAATQGSTKEAKAANEADSQV